MMRGLLSKSVREAWPGLLGFGAGLFGIVLLLRSVLPRIQEIVTQATGQLPIARTMFGALLGVNFGDEITAQMLHSIIWVHPVVLATVWGFEIWMCTRVPAGEIDRGTIDVLLGLPVSRRGVYLAETIAWLVGGVALLTIAAAAFTLGEQFAGGHVVDRARVALVLANFFALYVAVGSIALLASASSNRRGRAIAIVLVVVLGSMLLNFLAAFWPAAERLSVFGVLRYYRPEEILRTGAAPLANIAILIAVGAVFWTLGAVVWSRRDVRTL
jgi:ABC-type transport system involved in multi-copper enzyme maturation permease subunit